MKILILLIFTLKAITLNAKSQETYHKAKLYEDRFYNNNEEPNFSFWDVLFHKNQFRMVRMAEVGIDKTTKSDSFSC